MAMDQFFKIGEIKGESEDKDKKGSDGWINVLAWSWGMSNSGTTHTGGGGGGGKANVQDISFTKYIDAASSDLMLGCLKGTHHPKMEVVIRKAGDTPLEYLKLTMEECLVTSVSTGGSGGEDRLTENVTVNFATIKYEYTGQSTSGGSDVSPNYSWDIAANAEA